MRWRQTIAWMAGILVFGGLAFVFHHTTKVSPFSFADASLYQPLIKLVLPEFFRIRQALEKLDTELAALPRPTRPPTGGTIGFISNAIDTSGPPSWIRFVWERAQRIDAIAYVPARQRESLSLVPFQDALRLDFVFLLKDREVHRVSFHRPQGKVRGLRGLLPFFSEFAPIEADTVRVDATVWAEGRARMSFAVAEVFIFSEQRNIAPLANLTAQDSREGMLGISLDYIRDDMVPLGLPQVEQVHRFVGYRIGARASATKTAWIELAWPEIRPIDEVRLYPIERLLGVNTITAGFPAELVVEVWDVNSAAWKTVSHFTLEYSELPGLNPVSLRFPVERTGRLRLTVQRLWKPSDRSVATLALAELQCRYCGVPLEANFTVQVSDKDSEKPSRAISGPDGFVRNWGIDGLTDGMSTEGRILHERQWLRQLATRADRLIQQAGLRERLTVLSHQANRVCWQLTMGLLLFGFLGLVTWFIRREIKHHAQIRQIRDHLAADLHDDLGSNLSAISLYAQRLQSQLGSEPSPAFRTMMQLVRESVYNLKEMVSVTSPHISSPVSLTDRLKQIADIHCASLPYTFTVAPELEGIEIHPTHRRNLRLFLKEAIHNVVNHSHASCIDIQLQHDACGRIWLSVTDDGQGLPPEVLDTPNALSTLRLRAEEMEARFQAENLAQGGCRIAVSLTSIASGKSRS